MAFKKIQEYISTDDGTPGTLLIPKLILPVMIEEVDKALLPREMAAMVLNSFDGSTIDVNLETANTPIIREVGEGAEIPLDNQGYTNVTFTPIKYGVAIRITREMMEDSQFELLQRNIRSAGRRFAENENSLIIEQLDTGANTITGGAAITIANITQAMLNVEGNDFEPTDFAIGLDILNDLRNIDTFVEANKVGNTDMLQRGFLGTLFGMNVAKFSSASTALPNTNRSLRGYVFDRKQAYGIAIKRDITVENFDLPTFDMQGAVITQRIAVQALRTGAIAIITTT